MIICIKIIVKGIVQGVGYRYATFIEAHRQGILGFVKNQADGTVYIEAEADNEILKEFIIWCKEGSKNADVTEIFTSNIPLKFFREFKIEQ